MVLVDLTRVAVGVFHPRVQAVQHMPVLIQQRAWLRSLCNTCYFQPCSPCTVRVGSHGVLGVCLLSSARQQLVQLQGPGKSLRVPARNRLIDDLLMTALQQLSTTHTAVQVVNIGCGMVSQTCSFSSAAVQSPRLRPVSAVVLEVQRAFWLRRHLWLVTKLSSCSVGNAPAGQQALAAAHAHVHNLV
jgi:hypothetical protein